MADIRVFIADDRELIRYALRTLVEAEPDMTVVGEAHDPDATLTACRGLRPDVLVIDIRMCGDRAAKVCRAVRDACSETSVLVLTSMHGDDEVFAALMAGAHGYLLDDTQPERVVHAIRSVADGQSVFDSRVADRVISGRSHSHENDGSDPLSERELEVLQLMAKGLSNKEIGRALWIGETTVKTHVSHILRKLGQADRTQAVLAGVKAGLVDLES